MTGNYGYFDEVRREYVITDPVTPEPWINYLGGTARLNAFISGGAGGTAWYDQPHTGRLTRYRINGLPLDAPGFYLYIREGGTTWNPSFFPVMAKLDRWECRHGMGYTRFLASHGEIDAAIRYFIPVDDPVLVWDLVLENRSSRTRSFSVFPYIDYSLHGFVKDALYFLVCGNQARYNHDKTSGGLLSDYFAFEAPFMGKTIFSANAPFERYDMDRNRFIGRGRTEANPAGLERGLANTDVADGGFHACGVFELPVTLEPGERRRLAVKLAVGDDLDAVRQLTSKYGDLKVVDAAIREVDAWWDGVLAKCQVATPDPAMNVMLNAWLPKNIRSTMRNGRSISHRHPGDGTALRFRDTMQDIMPGTLFWPDETRQMMMTLLRSITVSGRVVTSIDPASYTCPDPGHTRSDAIVWGVFTIHKYLAETGDQAFLDTVLPYYDDGEGTVLEHLCRGMRFIGENTGVNGLPKIFDCDWNDLLQVFSNAKAGGESVMVAQQFIVAARLLVDLLRHLGRTGEIAFLEEKSAAFTSVLDSAVCWDGEWFKRLLYPDAVLGSRSNPEGKLFLNTQSWAAIAGTLSAEKVGRAMDSVAAGLDTECGIRLFAAPFTKMMDGVTRFHTNTPGAGENGGLFLHANTWAVIAEALRGNRERAWKYFSQIMPNNLSARNPTHYGREPYAFASWVYGPDHKAFGHAALTWLTGGAAWIYLAGTEYILGIRPTLDGVMVDPCVPAGWPEYSMVRQVRGATYHITVKNTGRSPVAITVDGKAVPGNRVPFAPPGASVRVVVS